FLFIGISVAVFSATFLASRPHDEPKKAAPPQVAHRPSQPPEDGELRRERQAEDRARALEEEAKEADTRAASEAARVRQEEQEQAELVRRQQEEKQAELVRRLQELRRAGDAKREAELASAANRDKNLRYACARRTSAPRPTRFGLAGGTVEITGSLSTLYMLTTPNSFGGPPVYE